MVDSEFGSVDFLEEEEEQDTSSDRKKRIFNREIRLMLYAFGDEETPNQETVNLVEDLAIKYILDITRRGLHVGAPGKLTAEDVLYLVSREPRKYSRVKELLILSEELRRAKKAFDEDEYAMLK